MTPKTRKSPSCCVMLASCVGLFSGCNSAGPSPELNAAGKAILDASEQCLYDVRDKGMRYDAAPNCLALGPLSLAYLRAGGGDPDTPPEVEIMYVQARAHAWTARAIDASGSAAVRIW